MPVEELTMWAFRYQFGKFGKKLDDYRFATQAKITDMVFSNGKHDPPLEKYIPNVRIVEHKAVTNKNLVIANAILGGGIVPEEVIKNVNSSNTDSPSEA